MRKREIKAHFPDVFIKLTDASVNYEYIYGTKIQPFIPHDELNWRVSPYATISYLGDYGSEYYAAAKGSEWFKIPMNTAVIFPAGVPFKFRLIGKGFLGNAHIKYTIFNHSDILSLFEIPYLISDPSKKIAAFINGLAVCSDGLPKDAENNISRLIRMKHMAYGLLDAIVAHSELNPEKLEQLMSMDKLSNLLSYIQENISDRLSRKTLADFMGLSETRFHYVFKEIMNTSPMAYLTDIRMKKAQHLLAATEKNISEIAFETGIGDIYYFSKLFKAKFNTNPLKYRQSLKELMKR